ncbi:nitrous oxide reductase accessory protein NosL [Sulfurospirillum sp. 1307]|jgi:nitrous oxide reductase accessory protein NosL
MRKIFLGFFALTLMLSAGNFRAVPMDKAEILQSGKTKMFCNVCGMTLPMFYKTNHAADIDGKTHQYCSIHCMFEEAMSKGVEVKNPRVVDNDTLKFMDATKAYYVVGSKQPGTMSAVSKYAFGTKSGAENFVKKFGGKIMSFNEVATLVKKNLKKEIAMIKKRQAKAAKKGMKIYNEMCKKTDKRFDNPALAKSYIKMNKLCGKLKGKPLQQVALYLSNR